MRSRLLYGTYPTPQPNQCTHRKVFVAVAGLEPATVLHYLSHTLYQLSYTAPYIFIRIEAHAGHYPCLRYFNIFAHSDIANLNPSVSSVNIRIPAAHSAFILSHLSLGLTLLPSCLIVTCRGQLVAIAGVGTYLVSSGCTYGFRYRLFPLLRL